MYIYKTDIDTFWGELEDGNYDITRMSWVGGGDPYDFLQPFDSDFPYNNTGYSNTDYDNLLDQSNTETNRTVRFQLLQQAQELVINRDFAVCPIYYRTQLAAVKPYLSGIANYNAFTFFFWTVQQGYNFTGFFQPVDMNGVINAVKAGSSIPIKFSLGGDMGLDIMDMGYPKALDFNPGLGSTTDAIETATAGNSGLTYDSVTNQYTYVWKTDKSWAGLCKVFVIRFNDGTESCAYFKFS
jgi:hypothetical protein